ncbi:MAG: CoA-binding protein [Candidatus Pacebacteria bacterium]|nr:CoA-binding protein [Candidatus Paceibacterota bacterium]MDD3283858.1 CoA-binding protein [Candidatus Paceibacterota bacterium]MDD3970040.1 CoA-binding protein [Candidatus Paceibacterota bacterium]MDD4737798.1 CoA-binding protein [Candidatus Paceibacterota bacterium]
MNYIFNPKAVALIGATEKENSVGLGLAKNMLNSNVFFVNPNRENVLGIKCYNKITDIEEKIDLAVVAVPSGIVKSVIDDCVSKKVKGVIIISGGFKEVGNQKDEENIRDILRENNIQLIGPNCLGVISENINASFSYTNPKKGSIAFLSQSGAIINSVIDKVGFSKIVSYGNEADLELIDFLEYLDKDKQTSAIAIYLEGIKDGKKFMEVAKKIKKPIVLIKAGRSQIGSIAVGTHTGALAGNYDVFVSAMKQVGVIVVDSIEELIDTVKVLAWLPKLKNGIGIITNGGGIGVLAADYCFRYGIELPQLDKRTLLQLKEMKRVPSKINPLDIIGDALPQRYQIAIDALLSQKDIGGLIVISAPQTMTDHKENAKIVVEMRKKYPLKPIVCCFHEGELEENNVPNYSDVLRAVKSIKKLYE